MDVTIKCEYHVNDFKCPAFFKCRRFEANLMFKNRGWGVIDNENRCPKHNNFFTVSSKEN